MTTPQGDWLAKLLTRAAERPPHRAYLDAVLTATENVEGTRAMWDAIDTVPVPRGVSARVAAAIHDDVTWIRDTHPLTAGRSGYPNEYDALRLKDTRAAAHRHKSTEQHEQADTGGLASLLGFDEKS